MRRQISLTNLIRPILWGLSLSQLKATFFPLMLISINVLISMTKTNEKYVPNHWNEI